MTITEFMLYVYLYAHLADHDRKMVKDGVVTSKTASSRSRKNIVSLRGQMLSFFCELLVIGNAYFNVFMVHVRMTRFPLITGITILSQRANLEIGQTARILVGYLWPCYPTIISIAVFMSSPELREHYISI